MRPPPAPRLPVRPLLALLILPLLGAPARGQAAASPLAHTQQARLCALAPDLDADSFALLGGYTADPSEVGSDRAASDYAACLQAALTRELRPLPQLSARVARLRTLYRQLNGADGYLAYEMMGGGTMYMHGVPRSFPAVEATLRTLAALDRTRLGGQTVPQYAASVLASRRAFERRVQRLTAWKPGPDTDYPVNMADYRRELQRYTGAGRAIMALLGQRGDAATAAGYRPLAQSLFVDDSLDGH